MAEISMGDLSLIALTGNHDALCLRAAGTVHGWR